ncbi:MAG: cache domain-containing protein [Bacteroidetes bacterium]|nr:cache domain-containing protein [Bacteroidota bacterium]MBL6943166.1 cache domain-containing protein [Bacteroidales bacterium]
MKTLKLLIIPIILLALFIFGSCTTCDCLEPGDQLISQYSLDKSIVEINTTNVSTGFETVFSNTITDSTNRAHFSQAFVNEARFFADESGYFFVETLRDAWVVAHINPDLIGTSRIDVQDENGKYFIREMVETVRYSGYGYVEYYRKNPTTGVNERKLSFVTAISSANWFIGAGFYGEPANNYYDYFGALEIILKEATSTMAKGIAGIFENIYTEENDRIEFCRDFIDHIRFFDDGSGYFFINNLNGINIAHGANPELQGESIFDIQDINGAFIIRDMIDIVESAGSGYYEYYWNNPASGNEEVKVTYVMQIPNTDYFIGAGFYLN